MNTAPVALLLSISLAAALGRNIIVRNYSRRDGLTNADVHFFNAVSALLSALVLLIWGGFGTISLFTLLCGIAFGLTVGFQNLFFVRALALGPWSYTTVIVFSIFADHYPQRRRILAREHNGRAVDRHCLHGGLLGAFRRKQGGNNRRLQTLSNCAMAADQPACVFAQRLDRPDTKAAPKLNTSGGARRFSDRGFRRVVCLFDGSVGRVSVSRRSWERCRKQCDDADVAGLVGCRRRAAGG